MRRAGKILALHFLWHTKNMDEFEKKLFSPELEAKIWRRCLSLTTDKESARDLMQDTYLKALENRDKFDGRHLDRWLFTICRNKFFDGQKKKKELLPGENLKEMSESGSENLESVKRDLEYCLEKLERMEREIMSMIVDFSYQKIADEFELSLSNTKVKVHRAREKLGKCMGVMH